MTTAIVWFRRDLRLEDNPALRAALDSHARVVCLYIHAPEEEKPWAPGAASQWWLHHSLAALDAELRARGASLQIRRGPSLAALQAVLHETKAQAVYWNRLYEPSLIERDRRIKETLRGDGIDAHSFNANLLFEPWEIQTDSGSPYKVFTPFWNKARARLTASPPLPAPRTIDSVEAGRGIALADLKLLPTIGWDAEFPRHWQPGERSAHRLLDDFLEGPVRNYKRGRDRPDPDNTSHLSPHLHFGEIGPRQIVWAIEEARRHRCGETDESGAYLRELGWRDFSHHLLFHFPKTPEHNLNPQFDQFPWARRNARVLVRWQQGRTGFPIVDAGMRQLWRSGWMHNRVRMIVASFLTKNLRQHWLHGARWFWDTLVDADLANNTQGWQWTAGSGADAAPYFRIFNPVSQAERFDPNGDYVRRWVPELAALPAPLIHQPWRDPDLLARTGYPAPMVELRTSREGALAAYAQMRGKP
ncbi:MAG TPA: deoxyribodipyrimidine photo-lyase [Rudaea sp.]